MATKLDNRRGLKPKSRKLATTSKGKLTGNQWQNTPQQNLFMKNWTDPASATFGNAYESAILAKYNPYYAQKIASPDTCNKWIGEYRKRLNLDVEHIKQGISSIAIRAKDSKSPDDTRLKAYEALARIAGLDNRNNSTNVQVNVTPILAGSSVQNVDTPLQVVEQ